MKKCLYITAALTAVSVFLFAGILVSSQTRSVKPTAAEMHYRRGLDLAKKFECTAAISEFDKAIQLDPQNAKFYTARAECKAGGTLANTSRDEYERNVERVRAEAAADLTRAIKLDPSYARSFFARAKVMSANQSVITNKQAEAALRDFNTAIVLEPTNAEYYIGRGEFFADIVKESEAAARDFDMAVKLRPASRSYRIQRAQHLALRKNYKGAIGDMTYLLARQPRDPLLLALRAGFYKQDGQFQRSLADYNLALKLHPSDAISILGERAEVYRALGQNDKAAADDERLRALQKKLDDDLDKAIKEAPKPDRN